MDSQVSGLPGWANQERYDIVAKADADTANRWKTLTPNERSKEQQLMMQSILADRCHFKAHEGAKELPVYNLVIAKGGLKIKDAAPDETPVELMTNGQMTAHAMSIDTIASAFAGSFTVTAFTAWDVCCVNCFSNSHISGESRQATRANPLIAVVLVLIPFSFKLRRVRSTTTVRIRVGL
jgi:uncharacterized protein (TIGR03435 family)